MEALIVVLLLALLASIAIAMIVGWQMLNRREQPDRDEAARLAAVQLAQDLSSLKTDLTQAVNASQQTVLGQLNAVETRVNQRFESMQGTVSKSMDGTHQTIKDVRESLGQLSASTRQMLEIGKDMSSLQDLLRPPKMRGGFGETLLGQLLANALPQQHYQMQYSFRSGIIVDAIVRMKQGLIPVDSKFPLEGFERMHKAASDEECERERRGFIQAVKKHVDSVTKYILQDEGTLPFVVMYIPSEAVFYEVIVRQELATSSGPTLSEYARGKSVLVVSPGTFYNLLQTVALGLRGLEVEEKAREIIDHLGRLQSEFQKVRHDFGTLGGHMERAKSKYEEVNRRFDRFDVRLNRPLDYGDQAELPSSEQQALATSVPGESPVPEEFHVNGDDAQ